MKRNKVYGVWDPATATWLTSGKGWSHNIENAKPFSTKGAAKNSARHNAYDWKTRKRFDVEIVTFVLIEQERETYKLS